MTTTRPTQELGADGITTNWVPFTTPGPPLFPCSSSFYYRPNQPSARAVAFDPYYGQDVEPLVKCLPTEQTLWWFQHATSSKTNINLGPFSCPNGYTTATVSTLNPITSLVACCPSQYGYAGTILPPGSQGQCNSTLTSGQTLLIKKGIGTSWTDSTVEIGGTGSEITGVHMNGYIFRDEATSSTISSSSIPPSASASTTSISPILTVTTASTSPTSTSSSLPTPSLKSEGLSEGGRIGVGVGVSLGVVGLISMLVAFVLFKRRDRSPNEQGVAENGLDSKPLQPTGSIASYIELSSDLQREPTEMWVTPDTGPKQETPRVELSTGS